MRAKKIILLAMADENELSVTKFMMETHSYRVLDVQTGIEAIAAFKENFIDLVIADTELAKPYHGQRLVKQLKEITPDVPMALLVGSYEINTYAGTLWLRNTTPADLLDRIRTITVRKRGPKKGCASYPRVPVIA